MVLQMPRPEPDAVHQAHPFDPSTADRATVDAERARERTIRTDQADRIAVELARLGLDYAAITARSVTTEPGW